MEDLGELSVVLSRRGNSFCDTSSIVISLRSMAGRTAQTTRGKSRQYNGWTIPFSQCLRIRRICSTDAAICQPSQELGKRLHQRGFPRTLLKAAVSKVTSIPRQETLCYKKMEPSAQRTLYVITHNPRNPPLARWLKSNMNVLHSSRCMKQDAPSSPIVGERFLK
ncbi:hypothetical protein ACOMHN_027044 [Nucella lapillus]